jgi:hypothetical protein
MNRFIIYNKRATTPMTPNTDIKLVDRVDAAPVKRGVVGTVVDAFEGGVGVVPETSCQFAQVIRVVLAKWMVMERFPKKEPMPETRDAKSSTYSAVKGSEVILPYFPDKSPT